MSSNACIAMVGVKFKHHTMRKSSRQSVVIKAWHVIGQHRALHSKEADSMSTTRAQSRKHRGYKTQRNTAVFLQRWFVHASSAGAGSQGSDVLHVPFDIEVKARDRVSLTETLNQLKTRSSDLPGLIVLRMNGQGDDASQYLAIMKLGDMMEAISRCKCGSWKADDIECQVCKKLDNK